MVAPSSNSASLKEYLKKYESGYEEEKTKNANPDVTGVIIVDLDPVWQKPVKIDDDMSPPVPRRTKKRRKSPHEDDLDLSPPRNLRPGSPVTIDKRLKTGLITGKDLKDEIDKIKKEEWLRFKEMDPAVSGQGAEPVYRDKVTGERVSKEEYLKSQKKPKEIKLEWGKGLVQKLRMEARLKELESEKDKPFARSRDDPEIENMLKERLRWGDPMAHLVKKKKLKDVSCQLKK